jgi:P27 family predicted phage terminase small subunit
VFYRTTHPLLRDGFRIRSFAMTRSRKRFDRLAPGPLSEPPAPPSDLDATGKEVWTTAASYLVDRRLLGTGDLHGLECYCRLVSRVRRVEQTLAASPLIDEDTGKPSPLISMATTAQTAAKNWALALHLVPYSRLGLSKAVKSEKTPSAAGSDWDQVIQMPTRA